MSDLRLKLIFDVSHNLHLDLESTAVLDRWPAVKILE